jgi:hypothetical protein
VEAVGEVESQRGDHDDDQQKQLSGHTTSLAAWRHQCLPASCKIQRYTRLVEHRNGFTVWYEAAGEIVGVLSLNAADDDDDDDDKP